MFKTNTKNKTKHFLLTLIINYLFFSTTKKTNLSLFYYFIFVFKHIKISNNNN